MVTSRESPRGRSGRWNSSARSLFVPGGGSCRTLIVPFYRSRTGPVAAWETSSDGGASWHRIGTQPVTKRTDEGTYRSTLELPSRLPGGPDLLVRAVFRNPHGKVTTDAVGLSFRQ